MKRFIILTTQRTGSTYLRILLNKHPDIESHGEVFLEHYTAPDGLRSFLTAKKSRPAKALFHLQNRRLVHKFHMQALPRGLILQYLDSLFGNPDHSGAWTDHEKKELFHPKLKSTHTGFKIMYNTLERYPPLKKLLTSEHSISVIHLQRRNLLKTFISQERLKLTGKAHSASAGVSKAPVYFSIRQFEAYARRQLASRTYYRERFSATHPYLELDYETLFDDTEKAAGMVLKFLAARPLSIEQPALKRMSTDRLQDEVTNWKELVDQLNGTSHEAFLRDFEY